MSLPGVSQVYVNDFSVVPIPPPSKMTQGGILKVSCHKRRKKRKKGAVGVLRLVPLINDMNVKLANQQNYCQTLFAHFGVLETFLNEGRGTGTQSWQSNFNLEITPLSLLAYVGLRHTYTRHSGYNRGRLGFTGLPAHGFVARLGAKS